jgi:hypothetical protein
LDSLAQTPLALLLQLGLTLKQRNLPVLHVLSCLASLPEFLPGPLSKTMPDSLPESQPKTLLEFLSRVAPERVTRRLTQVTTRAVPEHVTQNFTRALTRVVPFNGLYPKTSSLATHLDLGLFPPIMHQECSDNPKPTLKQLR